jgi:hypothetical protein
MEGVKWIKCFQILGGGKVVGLPPCVHGSVSYGLEVIEAYIPKRISHDY